MLDVLHIDAEASSTNLSQFGGVTGRTQYLRDIKKGVS